MNAGRDHGSVPHLGVARLAGASFVGGAAGSLLRGCAEAACSWAALPAWTSRVAVNVIGAFLIGMLFARIAVRDDGGAPVGVPHTARLREHLLGAGFLGGFTTVSGMAWDLARAVTEGASSEWLAIAFANAVIAVAACAAGFAVAPSRPSVPR